MHWPSDPEAPLWSWPEQVTHTGPQVGDSLIFSLFLCGLKFFCEPLPAVPWGEHMLARIRSCSAPVLGHGLPSLPSLFLRPFCLPFLVFFLSAADDHREPRDKCVHIVLCAHISPALCVAPIAQGSLGASFFLAQDGPGPYPAVPALTPQT